MKPYLSLGEAIKAFLEKNGLTETAEIQRVMGDWERLMGAPIAQNTEKLWFKGGVLFVKVSSPIWKNELQMARQKIKDTLNAELSIALIEEVKIV